MLRAGHTLAAMAQLHVPGLSAAGVTEIASLAVGLHAARTKTPFMTLRGRTAAILDPPIDSALRKAPQMRSTLHYVAESEFPELHAATARQRLIRRYRSFHRHGVTAQLAERLRVELLDGLSPEYAISEKAMLQLASRVIKGKWKTQASPSHMAWQLVRLVWDRADVKMVNASPHWSGEHRIFARSKSLRVVEEAEARVYLLKRYVEAYGPVTAKDIIWWTAFEASYVVKMLPLLVKDGCLQMVKCPEFGLALYCCSTSRPIPTAVEKAFLDQPIFLAYEDPFIKAYFETRFRYASPAAAAVLFYKTGEARASVMWRGSIRGIWEFGGANKPSKLLLCSKLDKRERELISTCWSGHLRGMGTEELTIQRSPIQVSKSSYE